MAKDDHSDEVISTENRPKKVWVPKGTKPESVIGMLESIGGFKQMDPRQQMFKAYDRLGHVHLDLIKKLLSKELVKGLPKLKFVKDKVYDTCQYGKQ
ncbi:hypothetical protein RJ640_009785 [Escallonia rubra]|uniref:GAG-pre-integrase domain-containing protein n=1 Tax=Escallonia rubra TaxID=112253 RepID=A0AA88UNI3_9ASTE|nr:hypothetical protein RJ640_009785 [Escallonia rubra]